LKVPVAWKRDQIRTIVISKKKETKGASLISKTGDLGKRAKKFDRELRGSGLELRQT